MKRVIIIVLLLSVLAACGDDKGTESAADKLDSSATTLASENGEGGGTTTTAPGKDGKGSNTGDTTPTTAGKGSTATSVSTTTRPPFPVKMRLEKQCIRKGQNGDSQVLHVETRPEDFVGYSTVYSDDSNEITNPSYKSGSGYGQADKDGKVRFEWKIPDTAPAGTATLLTVADGRHQPKLTFKIAGLTESC